MGYLLGLLIGFFLFILVKTLLFRPYPRRESAPNTVEVDGDRAIKILVEMVRCKTVSFPEASMADEGEFTKFRLLLKENYPLVHEASTLKCIGPTGLLYHWRGKSPDKPTVFMAHYDVVPADPQGWTHPPFAGVIEDGYLWGRGTLDTKGTLCAIMEGAEQLIARGFIPDNDIYLSFAGDEEVNGTGAASIVDYLLATGIKPFMVLDEGGAVVEGAVPGVPGPCALVGTGEKGKLHLRLTHISKGGHASTPPPFSPVGILGQAVNRIESKPLKFHLSQPVRQMFDILGRHASLPLKLLYANLGLFAPLFNLAAKKIGGEINALVRTTVAFTKMQASEAVNVFPRTARVEADVRLMEGATPTTVIGALGKRLGKLPVQIEALESIEVMPFSDINTEPWRRLEEGILQVWPEAKVAPYLMIAASDARHFTRICANVFRFSGMELTTEERKMIHGIDERIPLEKVTTTIKFFLCMMEKC